MNNIKYMYKCITYIYIIYIYIYIYTHNTRAVSRKWRWK